MKKSYNLYSYNAYGVDESLCSHLVEAEAETYPLFLSIYIN